MIAHIEVFDRLSNKYYTVGYYELDSNDIDRYNRLTFIGEMKIRSVYDLPNELLCLYANMYRVSILTEEGINKISMFTNTTYNDLKSAVSDNVYNLLKTQ